MAKRRAVVVGALEVLLALKTELWQSMTQSGQIRRGVLLALKTELWQSRRRGLPAEQHGIARLEN